MGRQVETLGILGVESLSACVHDLDAARRFYVDRLDFADLGGSSPELDAKTGQRSRVFAAGAFTVVCTQPLDRSSPAGRFLGRHPDGISAVNFTVGDAERALRILESRGGTPLSSLRRSSDDRGGRLAYFAIATPFGDTLFRFVQRDQFGPLFPGHVRCIAEGGSNRFGIQALDHLTTNFRTMAPALLWLESVMGFERFWEVAFHTQDVAQDPRIQGSGLRSVVMWDPSSGVKLANNEPARPFFRSSQIHRFIEDHRGDGIQHAALLVRDMVAAVQGLRATTNVAFMPATQAYYDLLPRRLVELGIEQIDEDLETLRALEVLVDGDHRAAYLLQIFLREMSDQLGRAQAGPFFYELIQRKGDRGFGAGNFRALFEGIEQEQRRAGGIQKAP